MCSSDLATPADAALAAFPMVDLSGATQQVECKQIGELIHVATITHGLNPDEGGYHWNGALRLWDNEILLGWYSADEGSVRSNGTIYFTLHPHGLQMAGRWVGLGYDDRIMTGWGSMAKTRENAEAVIVQLNRSRGGTRWQGEIHERTEGRASLHTQKSRVAEIIGWVKSRHPYDVPGISTRPIEDGNPDYLDWMRTETEASHDDAS